MDLQALLARAFGEGVSVVVQAVGDHTDALLPEEAQVVAKAVDKRRREFAAGRVAARRSLAIWGVPVGPLLPSPRRAPIWPEGFVGSISHSGDLCVVVTAPTSQASALGVDVEADTPVGAGLLDLVTVPGERRWLETRALSDRGYWSKALFCIKEAVFKCQFTLTETMLEFSEVEVRVAEDGAVFEARIDHPVPESMKVSMISGFVRRDEGWIIAGTRWPPTAG